MNNMIIKGKMPWSLIKFFLYLFIFIYLITSTIWCRTHNRAGFQLSVSLQITHPAQERLADVRAHCKKLCKEDMYVCPLNRDIYIYIYTTGGIRPLLFSNTGVGSFTSHKNR